MSTPDRWCKLAWVCVKCGHQGTAPRVWVRPGDTVTETARQFQRETRWGCVDGCAFSVPSALDFVPAEAGETP